MRLTVIAIASELKQVLNELKLLVSDVKKLNYFQE